jgi:hypothetical protein
MVPHRFGHVEFKKSNTCLYFFQVRLPEQNNNIYSKIQMDEVPSTTKSIDKKYWPQFIAKYGKFSNWGYKIRKGNY